MKKKLVTIIFALLAIASGASADDGVWVELQNGEKQGFVFADKPKITYETENLVLTSTEATATFPITDIKRIYFDDVATTVTTVNSDGKGKVVRVTGNGAEFFGFAAGTPVAVYALSGKSLLQSQVGQDGTLTVNLSTLPQGTYIIRAEKSTLKIQTR